VSKTSIKYGGYSELHPFFGPTDTSARLDYPQNAVAGISYRPTPDWNIEANVDWTDWDHVNTVVFKGVTGGDVSLPLNWHSSFLYELGVTRQLSKGYFASAGYFFSQNSTSERNFTPVVPDTDLHVASVGFGYRGIHWHWAISGQLITGPSRTVSGSVPSAAGQTADGNYKWFNQAVNLAAAYHF
jgi:long-chain fatty acid transport protein